VSWIAAALLCAPAAFADTPAQGGSQASDLPDNQEAFREKRVGSSTPVVQGADDQAKNAWRGAVPTGGERSLTGVVVRAEPDRVFVETQGAVVPLTITPYTRVTGGEVGRVDALVPGQEVRARYDVLGSQNFVTELTPAQAGGKGGGGRQTGQPALKHDMDLRTPSLSVSEGESKGPGSPMPDVRDIRP
jgi:hypothetical protein